MNDHFFTATVHPSVLCRNDSGKNRKKLLSINNAKRKQSTVGSWSLLRADLCRSVATSQSFRADLGNPSPRKNLFVQHYDLASLMRIKSAFGEAL